MHLYMVADLQSSQLNANSNIAPQTLPPHCVSVRCSEHPSRALWRSHIMTPDFCEITSKLLPGDNLQQSRRMKHTCTHTLVRIHTRKFKHIFIYIPVRYTRGRLRVNGHGSLGALCTHSHMHKKAHITNTMRHDKGSRKLLGPATFHTETTTTPIMPSHEFILQRAATLKS
jgi:hypothetical protein